MARRRATRKRRTRRRNAWTNNTPGHKKAAKLGWSRLRAGKKKRKPAKRKAKARKKNPYSAYGPSTRKRGRRRTARLAYMRNAPRKKARKASRSRKRRSVGGPLGVLKSTFDDVFSQSTFTELIHTAGGFLGAAAGADYLTKEVGVLDKGWGRVGATGIVSILESVLTKMIFKDSFMAKRVLIGGLVATAMRAAGQVKADSASFPTWIPTLGDSDTDFRKEIQDQVLRELRTGNDGYYLPAAGSESYWLPAAGSEAYLTAKELRNTEAAAGMGAYLTAKEGQELDTFGVASGAVDEIGYGGSTRERF